MMRSIIRNGSDEVPSNEESGTSSDRKETQGMFRVSHSRQNSSMCCRMLYSRAYYMAQAFGCMSMRLKILQK